MTREEAIAKYGDPVENHQRAMTKTADLVAVLNRAFYDEIMLWLAGPTVAAQQAMANLIEVRTAYGLPITPVEDFDLKMAAHCQQMAAEMTGQLGEPEVSVAAEKRPGKGAHVDIVGEVTEQNEEAILEAIRYALRGSLPLDPNTPLN